MLYQRMENIYFYKVCMSGGCNAQRIRVIEENIVARRENGPTKNQSTNNSSVKSYLMARLTSVTSLQACCAHGRIGWRATGSNES